MQPCDCLKKTMDVIPGVGRARGNFGKRVMGLGCCCETRRGVGLSIGVTSPWYSHPAVLGIAGLGIIYFLAKGAFKS